MKLLASEWNVDTCIWADCVLLHMYFSDVKVLLVEGRGEKLDVCAFDSVLCKMTTLLCLIALCKVMIISEMVAFIK